MNTDTLIERARDAYVRGCNTAVVRHTTGNTVTYPMVGRDQYNTYGGWLLYVVRDLEKMESVGATIEFVHHSNNESVI